MKSKWLNYGLFSHFKILAVAFRDFKDVYECFSDSQPRKLGKKSVHRYQNLTVAYPHEP